jgi:hypothetical protein
MTPEGAAAAYCMMLGGVVLFVLACVAFDGWLRNRRKDDR